MLAKPVPLALALSIALGAAGCGGDRPTSKAAPTPGPAATTSAATTPTGTPTASTSATSPAIGLPKDFPAQEVVPLVAGVVTSKTGGKDPDGRIGYVIEMSAVGSQQDCFDRAAAALVAQGYKKQGELKAQDTRQAQFTTKGWAVIISARADGDNCQLGYEVGQLGQ